MPMPLKEFQTVICDGIVAQFGEVRALYRQIAAAAPERIDEARRKDAAIVLQAPTGAGKTRMAIEVMRRVSIEERVLWFWFAPFTGLVEQSRKVLSNQAPELALLDLDADRQLDAVRGGGVFVVTWASLAARKAESRRARQRNDAGMAIDDVIAMAREQGLRIGCVVDEAHHGFQRETLARAFFCDVLKPDYALLMTATPRDADMKAFERTTGYSVGEPAEWASVSRADAVDAEPAQARRADGAFYRPRWRYRAVGGFRTSRIARVHTDASDHSQELGRCGYRTDAIDAGAGAGWQGCAGGGTDVSGGAAGIRCDRRSCTYRCRT